MFLERRSGRKCEGKFAAKPLLGASRSRAPPPIAPGRTLDAAAAAGKLSGIKHRAAHRRKEGGDAVRAKG
jgi:hypothetical protein